MKPELEPLFHVLAKGNNQVYRKQIVGEGREPRVDTECTEQYHTMIIMHHSSQILGGFVDIT